LFGTPSVNVYQTRLLPYAYSNSQRLRLRLNCSLVSVLLKSCGNLFQIVGPQTRKLRQPLRVDRPRGRTTRSLWSFQSRYRNLERAATMYRSVYITKVLRTSLETSTVETSPYRTVQKVFRYLEPFRRGSTNTGTIHYFYKNHSTASKSRSFQLRTLMRAA